jgi:poly(3-hydroxybutyrate) depolymerase
MKQVVLRFLVVVVLFGMLTVSGASHAAQPLDSYNVDITQTSVSGVSSGAYLAGQLHVAYAESMVGIGLIAGGPYYCSQGDQIIATAQCWLMGDPTGDPIEAIETEAGKGTIDDPVHLSDDQVYIFTGSNDTKVGTAVVDAAYEQYQQLVPAENILYVRNEYPAGHSMVTDDYGNACSVETGEYINDCDYDLAGELLEHIYGPLNEPVEPTGQIVEFDQSEFVDSPAGVNMHTTGFAYIPTGCANGEPCKVHIVIHGCEQSVIDIGDSYYAKTGYNEWGQANNIIMLYPQSSNCCHSLSCWDFFGYTDSAFHTREGEQVKTVMNMLKKLAGQPFDQVKASHWCINMWFYKFCW